MRSLFSSFRFAYISSIVILSTPYVECLQSYHNTLKYFVVSCKSNYKTFVLYFQVGMFHKMVREFSVGLENLKILRKVRLIGLLFAQRSEKTLIFLYGIALYLFLPISGIAKDKEILDFILYGSFILWLISIPVRFIRKELFGGKSSFVKCKNKGPFVISDTDRMDGVQFERWCAQLIIAMGGKHFQLTKTSGDQGVDIIAELGGIKYAIQCKRYSKPLGNKPIQEVNAGMQYYGCQDGAVMTNNYFTSGGKKLALATGVKLWDRNWIIGQINKLEKPENKAVKLKEKQEVKLDPKQNFYQETERETGRRIMATQKFREN